MSRSIINRWRPWAAVCAVGCALISTPVLAALEDVQTTVGGLTLYAFGLVVIVVAVAVYFVRLQDKRRAPVKRLFETHDAIHSVRPDTLVTECVRMMTARKIGALVVMDRERLTGIFTERDALNRVLAARLDPGTTPVCEVMTLDPYCISPGTTVAEAMKLITQRRFRHLPVVESGKLLAVVSSGDLTHWLVKDQVGEVQELVDLAAQS